MTTALDVSHRRAEVRRLAQGGASNRAIAAQMGISKDTVRRDLEATDAPSEAPPETFAQRLAHRRSQTETAVRQLSAAAQAVHDARPAYAVVDEETALRWHDELRAVAAQLTACAGQFAEYYPNTVARATACATGSADAP